MWGCLVAAGAALIVVGAQAAGGLVATPQRGTQLSGNECQPGLCHPMQCTYCIVPFTRGKEQSRTAEAIRREMLALGEAGYREVTLLGQNIDAYGRDLPGFAADNSGRRAWTFTDLLRYVHDVPGQYCGKLLAPPGRHGCVTCWHQ